MRLLITLTLSIALSAPLAAKESKATVYIYKNWHMATMGKLAYPVLMNDKEIAANTAFAPNGRKLRQSSSKLRRRKRTTSK